MVFAILQWNALSIFSNGQEFKKYIEQRSEKQDVICVQETWLRPHLDFILHGYVAVCRDRESDLIEYKKTQAEVRQAIRKAKRNYWKHFAIT